MLGIGRVDIGVDVIFSLFIEGNARKRWIISGDDF
jgi:hypothetical protein